MKKHFVIFMSPGTIVSETTQKEIDSWDIKKAKEMVYGIKERYGATPYGFYFITKERTSEELDSKIVKKSCMYYLGGIIKTIEEIREQKDPDEKILLSNMECNKWNRVIVNNNSYKITLPLKDDDVILLEDK